MSREVHVQFSEGLRVKLPRSTHHKGGPSESQSSEEKTA